MDGKVQQFVSITGASVVAANGMLEACGGDLDQAISMYLESGVESVGMGGMAAAQGPSSSGVAEPTEQSYEEMHGVRAPIPQTRGVLIEEQAPPTRVMRSRRLPQTVFDPFQDFKGHVPGVGDSTKKKTLAELFRPPHDLLFQGSFQEAREAGQHKRKWLLINLQDSTEFACQTLNRDIWSNHNVKDIVKQHFLFLQFYRITDEGLRFKQLYHVDSFPYIAIIDPRTGEKMLHWSSVGAMEFLTAVKEFLGSNSLEDEMDATAGSSDTVVDQSEESQLEAAIRASLEELQPANNKIIIFSSDDEEDGGGVEMERGGGGGGSEDDLKWTGSDGSDMDADVVEVHQGVTGNPMLRESTRRRDAIPAATTGRLTSRGGKLSDNSGQTPSVSRPKLNMDVKLKPCSVDINPVNSTSRKRFSSSDDELPRKAMRMYSLKSEPPPQTNHHKSQDATDDVTLVAPTLSLSRGKKGQNGGRKGKGRAKEVVSNDLSIEEQLTSGSVKKEDVSHIVIRLPEGNRVQKAFLCRQPIQELFDFLRSQRVDLSEHEVVTQFPRRSISTLPDITSFKDAGLYPRETVFVHPID